MSYNMEDTECGLQMPGVCPELHGKQYCQPEETNRSLQTPGGPVQNVHVLPLTSSIHQSVENGPISRSLHFDRVKHYYSVTAQTLTSQADTTLSTNDILPSARGTCTYWQKYCTYGAGCNCICQCYYLTHAHTWLVWAMA